VVAEEQQKRTGACNTRAEKMAAPGARETHAQEHPPACGGACNVR
jgi:hypothetical protein